jgi:hypothetical protein
LWIERDPADVREVRLEPGVKLSRRPGHRPVEAAESIAGTWVLYGGGGYPPKDGARRYA